MYWPKTRESQVGDVLETKRSLEYIQFVTLCWYNYLEGWNDGTNGPLLPRMQQTYGVGYTVVSFIFVSTCVGFIVGAFLNIILTEKLGFGKVMVLGALIQVIAYSIESAAPPFPLFVFAYLVNGVGLSLQNAQAVGYVASFKGNVETKMGIYMAAYGLGALSSPLVATQFAQIRHWSFHYLTSLCITLIDLVALATVFRFRSQQECLAQIGITFRPKQLVARNKFRQIFSLKEVHFLAAFILVYVGGEVTTGGWIVTYIINVRGGDPSSGYISTGFFSGLTIGRIALLWVNKKIGERFAIFVYAICAIGLELVIWFVPSVIDDAIAIAVIGILMGPMCPIAMNQCGRLLPPWILTGAVGWIVGAGHTGSAIVPFMAGAIASKSGIVTLQPVLVAILSLMTVIWALVPNNRRM